MKKEINIFILLKFLKYNSFAGKQFAICHAFLLVFFSFNFFAAQVGNGKDFSEIMISEGATIISNDPYFNDQIVDREIQIVNGKYQFDRDGITLIISRGDEISHNDHISYQQKLSYQEKKFTDLESDAQKAQEYQKTNNINNYHFSSIPFLPNNIFINRYGTKECLIINLLNFKASLEAKNTGLYYCNSLIEDMQQQKYPYTNKILLFLKTKVFFARPPPDKAGPILVFI